jgi:hypothetical protein
MFGINLGIATGLGMQWTLGIVTVVFLWVLGFPLAWYSAQRSMRQPHESEENVGVDALLAAWQWVNPPYVAINATLVIWFF